MPQTVEAIEHAQAALSAQSLCAQAHAMALAMLGSGSAGGYGAYVSADASAAGELAGADGKRAAEGLAEPPAKRALVEPSITPPWVELGAQAGVQTAAAATAQSDRPSGSTKPSTQFYKTRICQRFATPGQCHFGEGCTYAHGAHELRADQSGYQPGSARVTFAGAGGSALSHPREKTQMCRFIGTPDGCRFGDNCRWAHSVGELRTGGMTHMIRTSATGMGAGMGTG